MAINHAQPLWVTMLMASDLNPDNNVRRELGRQHMSTVMVYWLNRNGWSHPDFEAIAEWALNEKSPIHQSQLSHIRNQKFRMLGSKNLDAFGMMNQAIWLYNNDREIFRELGTATVTEKIERLISNKLSILHPETGDPLGAGEWFELFLGRIKIHDVITGGETDDSEMTEALAEDVRGYLSREIQQIGKPIHEVTPIARRVIGDEATARSIMEAVVGLNILSIDDLPATLGHIANLLNELDDSRQRTAETIIQEARS